MTRFLDEGWPIVVYVAPAKLDDEGVREMIAGFERYLGRGERYAVISHTSKATTMPGPKQRKAITDWANEPRVRRLTVELSVGSATVIPNALARGALTAILWFWSPPAAHQVCGTPGEAIDWCVGQLEAAKVPTRSALTLRKLLLPMLPD